MTHKLIVLATTVAAAVALVPQAAAASTGETCASTGGSAVYLVAESIRTEDDPAGGPLAAFPIEGTEIDTTIAETIAAGAQLSFPDGFDQTTFPETIQIGDWATLYFDRCGTAAPIDQQVDLSDNPEYRAPVPAGVPAASGEAAPTAPAAPPAAAGVPAGWPASNTSATPAATAPAAAMPDTTPAPTLPAPTEPAPTMSPVTAPAPTTPAPTLPPVTDPATAPPTRPTASEEEAGSEGTAVPLLATGGFAGAVGAVLLVLRTRRNRRA